MTATTDIPRANALTTTTGPSPGGVGPRHASERLRPSCDARGGPDIPDSQFPGGTHRTAAVGKQTPEPTNEVAPPIPTSSVSGLDTAAANLSSTPTLATPLPPDSFNGQAHRADRHVLAVGGDPSATPTRPTTKTTRRPSGLVAQPGSAEHSQIRPDTQGRDAVLADPTLALLADVLDDLERTRIANENRLRQLTRTETDSDGEDRGFGLPLDHPDVARLAGVVDGIAALEHQATLNLNRAMRKHPLGPWMKAQCGIGEKQGARLLAAIGDPYWNTLHNRPRTVSELWAYCGLHVIRADQGADETHCPFVGAELNGHPSYTTSDAQPCVAGVAARRRKGERANWSTAAKMRAWNIAGSMLKAGNRELYDKRKAATEGRTHLTPCVRCGPSGKPAQPGTPWSDGHRHADALRITSKALLKDLWLASRDIHLSHAPSANQTSTAEVDQP